VSAAEGTPQEIVDSIIAHAQGVFAGTGIVRPAHIRLLDGRMAWATLMARPMRFGPGHRLSGLALYPSGALVGERHTDTGAFEEQHTHHWSVVACIGFRVIEGELVGLDGTTPLGSPNQSEVPAMAENLVINMAAGLGGEDILAHTARENRTLRERLQRTGQLVFSDEALRQALFSWVSPEGPPSEPIPQ
jgi:hypothetical protein